MNYLNLKYSQDFVIDIYLKNKKDMPLTCLSKTKVIYSPTYPSPLLPIHLLKVEYFFD